MKKLIQLLYLLLVGGGYGLAVADMYPRVPCAALGPHHRPAALALVLFCLGTWAKACTEGHLWIVLPSSLDESLKADISMWRNQDQNENQPITDGELIRLCSLSVDDFLKGAPGGKAVQMPLHQLVASTCNRTPLRINPTLIGGALPFRVLDGAGKSP